MLYRVSLPLLLCAFLSSCTSALPEKRPADLRIAFHFDGGMLAENHSFDLAADSCVIVFRKMDEEQRLRFTLRPGEWDTLYNVFRAQRFDRIGIREEKGVHDRGGTSLRLGWGEEHFQKSNSGLSFVKAGWTENYRACQEAVELLVQKKINAQKRNVTLFFDESLFAQGFRWRLDIDDHPGYSGQSFDVKDSLVLRLVPGTYLLHIQGYRPKEEQPAMGYELTFNTQSKELFMMRLDSGEVKITPFVRVSAFYMDESEAH